MALRTVYERFLAAPTVEVLSPDASWNYITTTTSVTGGEQVVKHLTSQQRIVKKKGDKTLGAIETADALVLDVETTLEFLTGGGAYLPSLDDNFLADRVVTFPTVHIVRFNSQNQIQQVRLYWDQASLLKQVEVIGSRARNWPIRDANEQSRFISNVVRATAQDTLTPPPSRESASKPTEKIAAPYAPGSARPPPRDPSELFFSEPEHDSTPRASIISPRAGADRHYRPVRVFGDDDGDEPVESPIKPKIGSNKGFQPVRVFDQDEEEGPEKAVQQPKAGSTKNFHAIRVFEQDGVDGAAAPTKPELRYKTHPQKFSHFNLGEEGEDEDSHQNRRSLVAGRPSRPMSQWNFEDFNTPEKPRGKVRAQDVRHFGWSDNEDELMETPPARPRVVQPRRDAKTHLNLTDNALTSDADAEIAPVPQKRMVASFNNNGLSLYSNTTLYDEEGNPTAFENDNDITTNNNNSKKNPLGIVPNDAYRKKDFDPHWEVHDPSIEERQQQQQDEEQKTENTRPISSDRVKAVQMMTPSWDMYDKTPDAKKKATTTTTSLPKRASRAVFQPSWSLGDE
ncbi:hypothetical protein UA08_06112 [Talaromyces atroroseus]|uniref:Uncharacterized protein n=1 Tax=Talaromyces atroroseus TaxID=1441469 RepID=A0A225ABI4_TALAT|nr:hypothetical protein UA08_06112 [Talaromyces atroroseus]OKL58421.1 hypothetical protein UA08_06112 [Talaromyces atroroseus]